MFEFLYLTQVIKIHLSLIANFVNKTKVCEASQRKDYTI